MRSGKFTKYSEGVFADYESYGSTSPPEIDITKISVPVAMFVGSSDGLGTTIDNTKVRELLSTVAAFEVLD